MALGVESCGFCGTGFVRRLRISEAESVDLATALSLLLVQTVGLSWGLATGTSKALGLAILLAAPARHWVSPSCFFVVAAENKVALQKTRSPSCFNDSLFI